MEQTNNLQKTLRALFYLVSFLFAGPAFAVSASVQVTTPGQQPKAYEGATVSLGGVTAPVNSQGVATFEDVPAGEQELVVTGRNIHHRPQWVQVTEGATFNVRASHVTGMTSGGRFVPVVGGFQFDVDDWTINEATKHTRVTLRDPNGDIIFDDVFDDPTANETLRAPSNLKFATAGVNIKLGEVGGNSPWAAFYLKPMIGKVDAEISFLPDPGAPGCDCGYSGDGTVWGVGAEAVIKPNSEGRFFISIGLGYNETDTLNANVSPAIQGELMSAYTLEFEQKTGSIMIGIDGDVVAPFIGVQEIRGDAKLTGDLLVDAPVIDPIAVPGETYQFRFENKFENEATLAVAGLNFRIPGTGFSGLARWSGDGGNEQFSLQAFYTFGRR